MGRFCLKKKKGPHLEKKAYLGKKRGGIWYISKRNIFVWIEIIKTLNFAKPENKQSSEKWYLGEREHLCIGKKLGTGIPPQVHIPPPSPSLDKNLRRSLRPSMVPCMCPEQSRGSTLPKLCMRFSKFWGFWKPHMGFQGFPGIVNVSGGFPVILGDSRFSWGF